MTSPDASASPRGLPLRRFRSLGLERKLPLLAGLLLAAILTVSVALTYSVLSEEAETAAVARLDSAVRQLAQSAERSRDAAAATLSAMAADPQIHAALRRPPETLEGSLLAAARGVLDRARAEGDEHRPIELWRADGRRVAYTGTPSYGSSRPVLPLPAPDTTTGSPLFLEADSVAGWNITPVRDDEVLLGYIASQFRIGGPSTTIETLRELTGEEVTLYVRNADGSLWTRHPGIVVEPPVIDGDPASPTSRLRDGERMLFVEAQIANSPWVMALATPLRLVRDRAREVVGVLAGASALLLAIGLLVAWWVSRRITAPLAALGRAAEAIMHGDFSRRVQYGADDEIGRLAATFNAMAAEVEASRAELLRRITDAQAARQDAELASRAKSNFLAVMSHELRTPLNAIGGYAQLIEMGVHGPVTDAQREALVRIARNQAHLLTLITDVLNYAKLEGGRIEFAIADTSLAEILSELEELIEPQLDAAQLELRVALPDNSPAVRADRDKLQQILLNLVGNAIKFTPPGGRITIACDAADGRARIRVCDTGAGIPPDRLEAIFEPFVQADRTLHRPVDGVGLGLAIARDLARGMAGDVSVSSEPGAGSVFTVDLPLGARIMQTA